MSFFGDDGFELTGLPKGDYYLVAVDPALAEAWKDPRFFPAAAGAATRVSLDWGTSLTQDLTLQEVTLR